MLNGFNAQENATKVQRVGANLDELHGTVVIEMNPLPAVKKVAIADFKLDQVSPRAHVRHALISLNLTATKVMDGITKFCTRAHFEQLSSNLHHQDMVAADDELAQARGFLLELEDKNRISHVQRVELMGLLRVRMGGFLFGLGEKTFEAKTYQIRTEVVVKFLQGGMLCC